MISTVVFPITLVILMSFEKKWSWNFKYLTRKWALKIAKIAKMSKKNVLDLLMLYIKRCALKNAEWLRNSFLKISNSGRGTSWKLSKLATLWQGYQFLRFLAKNFFKDLYFQKRISQPICIFQGASLDIYYYQIKVNFVCSFSQFRRFLKPIF